MQTPTQTIRKWTRWLGLAVVALAIAVPAANAGLDRSQALATRMHAYPYDAPYGPARSAVVQVNPLAGRLHIYPYEAPYGPARSAAVQVNPLAGRLHIYPYETPFGPEAVRHAASSPQGAEGLLQASRTSKVTSAANHFDWGDAAIGAAGGFGLALLAAVSALAIRRGRNHVAITG